MDCPYNLCDGSGKIVEVDNVYECECAKEKRALGELDAERGK